MIEVRDPGGGQDQAKEYGLAPLARTRSGVDLPAHGQREIGAASTNVRAHLLSSLNLADCVVSVPQSIFAKFLQTDGQHQDPGRAPPARRRGQEDLAQDRPGGPGPRHDASRPRQTGGTTFSPATSFQYRNVGVNLDITPKVNPSGDISLEMTAEFSLLGAAATVGGRAPVPPFSPETWWACCACATARRASSAASCTNPETTTRSGAPGDAEHPDPEQDLRQNTKSDEDQEILISITPHILRSPKVTEEDLTALGVGTEEMLRVEGARPPLFGEPEAEPKAPTDVIPTPPRQQARARAASGRDSGRSPAPAGPPTHRCSRGEGACAQTHPPTAPARGCRPRCPRCRPDAQPPARGRGRARRRPKDR